MGAEHRCGPARVAGSARFYRYEDASGRLHLVDSLEDVPQVDRARATCIEYADESSALGKLLPARGLSGWQMFGLGFGAALLVAFAITRMPRGMRWLARLAIIGGLLVVLGSAYLGWIRRQSQQSSDAFASPSAMIDDAKSAVAKMNARIQAEQAELKETEQAH